MAPTATTSLSSTTISSTATATCLNIAPGKNGYLPPEACDVVLYYVPSFAAAVLFCVFYGMTTLTHLIQAVVYKKPYAWVVIMGGAWELLAFIFRALQTRHQDNANWDTLYVLFFLLAPIWINAFLYMTLGRMIHFFLPDQKLVGISARKFGVLFVCLDIFAFLVQAAGALMSSAQEGGSLVMTGLHIYMGGVGLQEFFILCFTALAIDLHRKLIRMENSHTDYNGKLNQGPFSWRWLFYTLYFTLGMITIRIIFRLGQYAQGTSPTNPILTHEWYEYVFDAVPMLAALVALNIIHPGRILQGPDSGFKEARRAEKEANKEKKQQKKMAKEEKKSQKKIAKEGKKQQKKTRSGDDVIEEGFPLRAHAEVETF
ncbi:lipid transporter atnI [Penicillium subrubescens]|uniref:lipid transporter atnI n=1 Tax=Penicillium subrubescens TaxID=1316194 RepID=UPI0025455189|nr:lipid transporter atnI [Penicillium subrubescens]KAJ5897049.1 lipid transporter atnI [Penicillium subrubescens]